MNGALLKLEEDSTITIGLHPALSPVFNMSFRNPFYYPQKVSPKDFTNLLSGDEIQAEAAKDSILRFRMRNYEEIDHKIVKKDSLQMRLNISDNKSSVNNG